MKKLFVSVFLAATALTAPAQDYTALIPLPRHIEPAKTEGTFTLTEGTTITYDGTNTALARIANQLATYTKAEEGLPLLPEPDNKKAAIRLAIGLKNDNPDAYTITVDKRGILITGATESGVFYGMQTLRKTLAMSTGAPIQLPWATITDAPRFGYRGVHLDCARHFFPVDAIKRYIDILALHGCNQFHWHITDDQGWRFEVKALPDLAKKASVRRHTVIGNNCTSGNGNYIYDDTPETGYYTQEDCREIVRYAAERYINIIPEIDLPGHMVAALSVYPELGCTGGPYEVWPVWGVSDDVLCAGNPKTMEFLKTVLTELADVFPSTMIHIGGDESPRVRWEHCPKCQQKMKDLGLTKEAQLQTYINKELETYMKTKGRSIIGWDETLEGGLSDDAIVMSWRGSEGGIEAARLHHRVIMTPNDYCYFDYYQSKKRQPLGIGGYLPVSQVYKMDPVPSVLTPEEGKYILGAQCNLWTEYVVSEDHVQYMLLPRLCAMSEVQWVQPDQKNFEDFKDRRLPHMTALFKKLGYTYAPFVE